ncbi:MAG: hypothetical protein C4576_22345 [Desulfobacteraceae bacterium]|nr:MAG: hypothetical protein C4576_22345 [Desulfobacteraceae bacterium]
MNPRLKMMFLAAQCFFLILFLSPALGAGYTEVFHSGKIDWFKWVAEAVGTTVVPSGKMKSEKARTAASEEAVKSAKSNLFDLVGKIKVDSVTTVKDLMTQSEPLRKKIQELVQDVSPKKVRFGKDGRVEALVSMPMYGDLSELVLPNAIRAIDSVQPNVPSPNSKDSFTGLIVECTGIRVRPSIFPSIFDEDGQLVFGSPYIHREHAIKRGVAAYTRDVSAAEKDERVSPRPLIVKGIRAAASGASDIVISNSDAAKVRANASHLKLLQNCRIMIVLE